MNENLKEMLEGEFDKCENVSEIATLYSKLNNLTKVLLDKKIN